MSQNTKLEVLKKLRWRYVAAGLEYRKKLIDQAVELMGYHRKSAIRALSGKRRTPEIKVRIGGGIGRPRVYEPERLLPVLKVIWKIGQQPCGRRLEAMMPEWVPAYESFYHSVGSSVREQLLEASSATLDRLLRPVRAQGRSTRPTRPGTMIRNEIPIRGGAWQSDEAGWTEADTVSLCGGNATGEVIWMLDNVDICTTWVEMRAMFGRGQEAAVAQLKDIEEHLPFPWLGFTGRINELARGDLGHFVNLFSPSMKMESQETTGGKTRRIYGKPLTPYARVLSCGQVSTEKKAQLQRLKESLNPFALEQTIQKQLRAIDKIRRALE